MIRNLTYRIDLSDQGITIEQFLKKQGYSHAVIVHLKKTPESVRRNGKWSFVRELLSVGDILEIVILEEVSSGQILPVNLPLDIVYEDSDILVINKPAGMPIHPSVNNYDNTLANAVLWYYTSRNCPFVFRCINRLDRDTSGLTVIAKHLLSAAVLSKSMQNDQIHREYFAIVEGITEEEGIVTAPIGRLGSSVIERTVDWVNGEHAVTHFRRLDTKNGLSLLSLTLETGRTHQIRVHMTSIGHPLIGDFLYHPDCKKMKRQALHAGRLSFIHPVTGEQMTFTAPIPDDFIMLTDL